MFSAVDGVEWLTRYFSLQVQLALLTATVKLFIKRPTAGQTLVPKVLKWATEEVDNPDLRDRGFIYWRMLSTDPAAATNIVLADKPAISTESEVLDRGLLDRLLLHTGTLASIYQKEAHTFVRGARPKYLQDSPALSQEARDSYLEAMRLPILQPAKQTAPSNDEAPSLPARPAVSRQESSELMGASGGYRAAGAAATAGLLDDVDEGDDEEEGAALNPNADSRLVAGVQDDEDDDDDDDSDAGRRTPTGGQAAGGDGRDEPLDPYASLARMSMDDDWAGLGSRGTGSGGYGYSGPQPVNGGKGMDDLLLCLR